MRSAEGVSDVVPDVVPDAELLDVFTALGMEQKKRLLVGIGMRNFVGVIDWRLGPNGDANKRSHVELLLGPLPLNVSVPPIYGLGIFTTV